MTLSDEQMKRITDQVMSDKTIVPLLIAPRVAWPIAQTLRVAARHPSRPAWVKKSHIALAKRFEKAVKAWHPIPDIYTVAHLEPIMLDGEPLSIDVTMREAFEIVCDVQLVIRHPDIGHYAREINVQAAKQIQGRIIEHHPDAWLLIQMGWDERYDV